MTANTTSPKLSTTNSTGRQITRHNVILINRIAFVSIALAALILKILLYPKEIEFYNLMASQASFDHTATTLYVWSLVIYYSMLSLIFYVAGWLIFLRKSTDWMGPIIATMLVAFGAGGVSFLNATLDQSAALGSQSLFTFYIIISGFAWFLIFPFLILFPNGRIIPRWTALSFLGLLIPLMWTSGPQSILYPPNWSPLIFMVMLSVIFGLPILGQFQRYRHHSSPTQRQQTKIVFYGLAIFITGMIGTSILKVMFPALAPLDKAISPIMQGISYAFFAAIPISLLIAMLRYRLWAIDMVINRSLVYGLLTGSAVLTFFGVAVILQIVIGEQQPLIALVISSVIAALAANPVRNRVEDFVDKRIYGLRFDLHELNQAQLPAEITNPGVLTGKVIDGYTVQGVIGEGGMGEVYKGINNGQTVAIKTMLAKIAKDPDMKERFRREAQAGMNLDHPNIAKVLAHGVIDDMPYLIMEYVEGQDLSDHIKQHGIIDAESATQYMKNIGAALITAHKNGFVHRDLKPSNIMIKPDGTAVLMDFGVTKVTDASSSLTGTGAIGTIDYMAPEQIISAKEVDHRADIYALGVMLYQMLTGEKPFSGNPGQLLFAHLQQPPPDPRAVNSEVPKGLAKAILKAMAKDPDERFDSVEGFVGILAD